MNTAAFDDAYHPWIEQHIKKRKGESRRRLKDGHNHAEQEMLRNVWWPAFGHFQHLHPEFEVQDFSGGFRYVDFAYIRSNIKIAIEVDGYGPHLRNLSRRQFCDRNGFVKCIFKTIIGLSFESATMILGSVLDYGSSCFSK